MLCTAPRNGLLPGVPGPVVLHRRTGLLVPFSMCRRYCRGGPFHLMDRGGFFQLARRRGQRALDAVGRRLRKALVDCQHTEDEPGMRLFETQSNRPSDSW